MSKIVIIGAGFTGALAARRLARKKYTVTLIDRKSHFLFLPRLADILAGASSERWTRAPLDKLAQRFGYAFVQGNVVSIDRDRRRITLADGQVLDYDTVVLAIGSEQNFFGVTGAQQHCVAYRTFDDALALQKRAAQLPPGSRIIVVGGGATGTELAASLFNMTRKKVGLTLVNATSELMGRMHPAFRKLTTRTLTRQGIQVLNNTPVAEVSPGQVKFTNGKTLHAELIVWAGGITPVSINIKPMPSVDDLGHVLVDKFLSVDPHFFAGGDLVNSTNPDIVIPKSAQHARQMGQLIAENIHRHATDKPLKTFWPHTRGLLLRLGSTCLLDLYYVRFRSPLILLMRDVMYRQRMAEITGWRRFHGR